MFISQSGAERNEATPCKEAAAIKKNQSLLKQMIAYNGIAFLIVAVAVGWQPLPGKAKKTPARISENSSTQTSLPRKGLASSSPDTVVLSTNHLDTKIRDINGLLFREIIRQALLISARDGLSLKSRDQSLRGEVVLVDNPKSFPLSLVTTIDRNRKVHIELYRPGTEERSFQWNADPIELAKENWYETLVEQTEKLSRTGFIEALKAAGYKGREPKRVKNAPVPDEIEKLLEQWNFISQFSAVRQIHAAIRESGESPERLAALARAYAHLGTLTEFHWSPAHKVFKARALLYAERLMVQTESTAWALAHRSYVRALVGRHRTALEDIAALRLKAEHGEKSNRPLPEWIALIEAYCTYQPNLLDAAVKKESQRSLALYLRMLLFDPVNEEDRLLAATEELLKFEPACCRALDALCETRSLGIRRTTTEYRLARVWPTLYERLLTVSDLPDAARDLCKQNIENGNDFEAESKSRIKVIKSLKTTVDAHKDDDELKLSCLGQLLHEVTFAHAHRMLEVRSWDLAMEADDLVAAHLSLVKGHPYQSLIKSYSSNRTESRAASKKLVESRNPDEIEINAYPMLAAVYMKYDRKKVVEPLKEIYSNTDYLQREFVRYIRQLGNSPPAVKKLLVRYLWEASPHMPQTIAWIIETDWKFAQEHVDDWDERYSENASVLQALVQRYVIEKQDDKAEKILEQQLAVSPNHRSYTTLADIYLRRGETEKWKQTLDKAIKLPARGLENARLEVKLARHFMRQGDWETAQPYADGAAGTYSAWGLICAADCYEGLKDWKRAESYIRACSNRYKDSTMRWYFWCARTGRGDLDSARQLAQQKVDSLIEPLKYSEWLELGTFYVGRGDSEKAYEAFHSAFKEHSDAYSGLHAALLADELNRTNKRDELLKQIAELWTKDSQTAELAGLFQRMLLPESPADWNSVSFNFLFSRANYGRPTNFYYFSGKFLHRHGSKKQALRYLQLAASSPATDKYNAMMAAKFLRDQKVEIKELRITEVESDLAPIFQLLSKAIALQNAKEFDDALEAYNVLLRRKQDFEPALVYRARIHESLFDYQAAIADYEKAIEVNPESNSAHNNLAMLLAACEQDKIRDGVRALKHAEQAFQLAVTRHWVNYAVLAVTLAETGDFDKAVKMQQHAVRLAPASEKSDAQSRLDLFKDRKPYRRSLDKK